MQRTLEARRREFLRSSAAETPPSFNSEQARLEGLRVSITTLGQSLETIAHRRWSICDCQPRRARFRSKAYREQTVSFRWTYCARSSSKIKSISVIAACASSQVICRCRALFSICSSDCVFFSMLATSACTTFLVSCVDWCSGNSTNHDFAVVESSCKPCRRSATCFSRALMSGGLFFSSVSYLLLSWRGKLKFRIAIVIETWNWYGHRYY